MRVQLGAQAGEFQKPGRGRDALRSVRAVPRRGEAEETSPVVETATLVSRGTGSPKVTRTFSQA